MAYSSESGKNGNMWVAAANGAAPLAGNTPITNVFNSHNQITGASYEAAGNLLGMNADTLLYDAENRMVRATEPASLGGAYENYGYDGLGQRVERAGPTPARPSLSTMPSGSWRPSMPRCRCGRGRARLVM